VIYLYFILASALYLVLVGSFAHISFLYMMSLIGIMLVKRQQTTMLHLCGGLLLFKIAEMAALAIIPTNVSSGSELPHVWLNARNYFIHLIFDVSVLAFLILRPALSRHYLRKFVFPPHKTHTDEELTYSHAEAGLIGVMFLYFFVDLAALVENFIRNMDYLGVDDSIAQYFWNWALVFHLYAPVKNFLNLFELLIIWLSVSPKGGKRMPAMKNLPFLLNYSAKSK